MIELRSEKKPVPAIEQGVVIVERKRPEPRRTPGKEFLPLDWFLNQPERRASASCGHRARGVLQTVSGCPGEAQNYAVAGRRSVQFPTAVQDPQKWCTDSRVLHVEFFRLPGSPEPVCAKSRCATRLCWATPFMTAKPLIERRLGLRGEINQEETRLAGIVVGPFVGDGIAGTDIRCPAF